MIKIRIDKDPSILSNIIVYLRTNVAGLDHPVGKHIDYLFSNLDVEGARWDLSCDVYWAKINVTPEVHEGYLSLKYSN